MAGKVVDKYANLAALHVTQSVANTAKYDSFAFPFSIMDKVGLLIHRIEYQVAGLQHLNTSLDCAEAGICSQKDLADPFDITVPSLIDYHVIIREDIGVAASGLLYEAVKVKDFSRLPGGGILVAPNPLYAFLHTGGAADVMNVRIRMYYTYMELAAEDYWQLVESRRIISG